MTGEPRPRIGDLVYDEAVGRDGVVTDIKGRGDSARFLLRPVYGFGFRTWFAEDADRLTVLEPREERAHP